VTGTPGPAAVRLEPWSEDDLALLEKLNSPEMWHHLGGPESPEQVAERQRRYERLPADRGRMFKIVDVATGEGMGQVGYWVRTWQEEPVYEIGWMVLPTFQGRGIASRATAEAVARARAERRHRFLHAFPSVENAPSNTICRKLGFTLVETCEFEFPPGNSMLCNDWRLDLWAHGPRPQAPAQRQRRR
jgi:RimJ/RimL family protein N-acetyltransferase